MGPFTKGVIEGANRELSLEGALRFARNVRFDGIGRLKARNGDEVAMTLKVTGGSSNVTSVVEVIQFADFALAVGHSTVTDEVYLYRFTAAMTGWYNAAGALQSNLNAEPVGVLWTACTTAPAVSIAEGLNEAYIAHNGSLNATALSFPLKKYTMPGTIATVTADFGAGVVNVYALGAVSYNQHLWIWGFDKTAVAGTAYRPEKLRHSAPYFDTIVAAGSGSFDIGHRVRSAREGIQCGIVAGEVLYIGGAFGLWAIVGEGRDSFQKKPLSSVVGIAGLKAACEANGVLYGWSYRGPFRVSGFSMPEELHVGIPDTVAAIANPQRVIAAYDEDRDQVCYFYDSSGVRKKFASYDITRDVWLGPDSAIGVGIACANRITPVTSSAVALDPPTGPPTAASTSSIGSTTAVANWANGDVSAGTSTTVEYRIQGATAWSSAGTAGTAATSFTITGLSNNTAYEWRAAHLKNGQLSAYLGPVAGSQFTTAESGTGTGDPMSPPTGLVAYDYTYYIGAGAVYMSWTNSGETDASTQIVRAGPSGAAPADGDYSAIVTKTPDLNGHVDFVPSTGTWWYKVRHVRGVDSSAYTAAVSVPMVV